MLLRSFTQKLSIVIFLLAFIVWIAFGTAQGWFGPGPRGQIEKAIELVIAHYSANEPVFELAFRALGLAATGVTGLFGIYKALYFAERNLPKRLEAYIKRIRNKSLIEDRDRVIARVMQSPEFAIAQLEAKQPEVDRIAGLIAAAKSSWDYQRATLHYAYGRRHALIAEADNANVISQADAVQHRDHAMRHYAQAADLDPLDVRALILGAEQAEIARHHEGAIKFWRRASKHHEGRGETFQLARALYGIGKANYNRSLDASARKGEKIQFLNKSRDDLEEACKLLRSRSDPDWYAALAECAELLGNVRSRLDTIPTAIVAFAEAERCFTRLQRDVDVSRVQRSAEELRRDAPSLGDNPNLTIAQAYERLGTAHLGRDDIAGARSIAERNLRLALVYYESIEPSPEGHLNRVRVLLKNPWLN